jgi:hypothetical protein
MNWQANKCEPLDSLICKSKLKYTGAKTYLKKKPSGELLLLLDLVLALNGFRQSLDKSPCAQAL